MNPLQFCETSFLDSPPSVLKFGDEESQKKEKVKLKKKKN